jgi:hypothetical protein
MRLGRDLLPISEFLPPHIREALLQAAQIGDHDAIDRLTDIAARQYPELVLPRCTDREAFAPRGRK